MYVIWWVGNFPTVYILTVGNSASRILVRLLFFQPIKKNGEKNHKFFVKWYFFYNFWLFFIRTNEMETQLGSLKWNESNRIRTLFERFQVYLELIIKIILSILTSLDDLCNMHTLYIYRYDWKRLRFRLKVKWFKISIILTAWNTFSNGKLSKIVLLWTECPLCLCDHIKIDHTCYCTYVNRNYETRLNSFHLNIKAFKSEIRRNFYTVRAVDQWNNLPNYVKDCNNVNQLEWYGVYVCKKKCPCLIFAY